MEAHLVSSGSGPVVHVPLTYREAPLVGADEWLIAKTEHSFLGTRWIYNACGDPVYVQELVRVILTGGSHVEQFIATDDGPVPRPSTASETVPLVHRPGPARDRNCHQRGRPGTMMCLLTCPC
jgi:Maltokinase N-terminal cap domain